MKTVRAMIILSVFFMASYGAFRFWRGGDDSMGNTLKDSLDQESAGSIQGDLNRPSDEQTTSLESAPKEPTANQIKKKYLHKKDLIMGSGRQVIEESYVSFHVIMKQMDGKVVFNSKKDGKPWIGVIGDASLISGIDLGIRGMFVGGKRALWIPPHLAYGVNGIPGQVAPDSQLYAEIEILEVR